MPDAIKKHFTEAKEKLEEFISNDENFLAIEKAGELIISSIQSGAKVISCGNGGSMCDAMHFAEELTGRFRNDRPSIPALSISDPSHITCVGNDYGFEEIFSRFIEGVGAKNDILFAISTSGNSVNILKAIHAAKDKGMLTIGLTGKNGGEMSSLLDIEIRAPHSEYADRAQEIHIKIIHSLINFIEENIR